MQRTSCICVLKNPKESLGIICYVKTSDDRQDVQEQEDSVAGFGKFERPAVDELETGQRHDRVWISLWY